MRQLAAISLLAIVLAVAGCSGGSGTDAGATTGGGTAAANPNAANKAGAKGMGSKDLTVPSGGGAAEFGAKAGK